MTFQFKLPDIGEGIQEGEIVRWIKKEGDQVKEDEPVVKVMTDKATVELTSPRKGKLVRCHFQEGDVAKVGQVILEIDEGAVGSSPTEPEPAKAESKESKPTEKKAEAKPEKEEKTLFELPKEMAATTKNITRNRPGATPATKPQIPQAPAEPKSASSAQSAAP